jgi:hypothetical protein
MTIVTRTYVPIRQGADRIINRGTATIASGAATVVVSHGLGQAPNEILVTPGADPAGYLWVDTVTATAFTINADGAVGADTPVSWCASCGNILDM